MSALYAQVMPAVLAGRDLDRSTAEAVMTSMLTGGESDVGIAAFLTALTLKGESADEIAGFATAMRQQMQAIEATGPVLDTCGTGGSGLPTLNTSTLAAFVAAAAGVTVAKHGNRASSGQCGSMDVLEALGVNIDLAPAQAQTLLDAGPIVFLNARRHHPALGPLGAVRRALGFRTVFNFLGPICNPARATHQLVGVSDGARAPALLASLGALGTQRALVVAGEDGLDELSLAGPTRVWTLADGEISEGTLRPEDVGLETTAFDAVAGGDVAENAAGFLAVLGGADTGPRHAHTALNAGAALFVAGAAASLAAGVERAGEILRSGAALGVFEAYRDASQAVA